jgi:hypothetical protein
VGQEHGARPLRRDPATVLQLNIGLYCNQACSHCHVESSPLRTEQMDARTAARCIQLLAGGRSSVRTLDLTGGAPELNPQFRCGRMPQAHELPRGRARLTALSLRAGKHLTRGVARRRWEALGRAA